MDQERAVNKILRDLRLQKFISQESVGYIRPYLMALYTTGWENGCNGSTVYRCSKPVAQYDLTGRLVGIYNSKGEAARKTGYSEKGIYNAIFREKATRQGYLWKFM